MRQPQPQPRQRSLRSQPLRLETQRPFITLRTLPQNRADSLHRVLSSPLSGTLIQSTHPTASPMLHNSAPCKVSRLDCSHSALHSLFPTFLGSAYLCSSNVIPTPLGYSPQTCIFLVLPLERTIPSLMTLSSFTSEVSNHSLIIPTHTLLILRFSSVVIPRSAYDIGH